MALPPIQRCFAEYDNKPLGPSFQKEIYKIQPVAEREHKIGELTLNKWSELGPAEKQLVMEGLANIAPKAALAKFKVGNRFSDEIIRTTPFMDILIHIGKHNENYEFTEWSCFDRTKLRQPAVQIGLLESTNQNKENTYKTFTNRKYQKSYQQNYRQNHQHSHRQNYQQNYRQDYQEISRQNSNQDPHYRQTNTEHNRQNQSRPQQQNNNTSQQLSGNSYTQRYRGQRASFPRDPTGTCIHHGAGHTTEQCVTGITRAQAESQRGRGRGNYTNGNGVHNQTRANTQSTSNPTQNNQQRGGRGQFRGRGRGYNNNRGRGGYGNRQINSLSQEGHLPLPDPEQHTGPQQQNFQAPPQAPSTTLGIIQTSPIN